MENTILFGGSSKHEYLLNSFFIYGDFRYSDELVPLGIVESGLDVIAGQTEDFAGVLELLDMDE